MSSQKYGWDSDGDGRNTMGKILFQFLRMNALTKKLTKLFEYDAVTGAGFCSCTTGDEGLDGFIGEFVVGKVVVGKVSNGYWRKGEGSGVQLLFELLLSLLFVFFSVVTVIFEGTPVSQSLLS